MAEHIEREALLAHLRKCKETSTGSSLTAAVITAIQSFVEGMPLADVAPVVHGKWIEDHDYLKCPECGVMVKWDFTFFDIGNWNYCPNCGAKMDGKGEDDGQKD